jgi:hypothetical protein
MGLIDRCVLCPVSKHLLLMGGFVPTWKDPPGPLCLCYELLGVQFIYAGLYLLLVF